MCLISLVLDIRLDTLTFKSFTVSGIQIFAYELLMLLQLPLYLLILILKGYNIGLLLLISAILGLNLHSRFFNEIQLNGVAHTKLDKHKDASYVKYFVNQYKHFYMLLCIYIYGIILSFFIK